MTGGTDSAAQTRPATSAVVVIAPDHPVFIGHYPGFAVVPGVLIVGCVQEFLAESGFGPAGSAVIEKIKFRRPVRPGDSIEITVMSVSAADGRTRVAVGVTGTGGKVATLTLHYPEEPA